MEAGDFAAVMPVRVPGTPAPIRALVIDLGTNSFHAVIVDAHANGAFELLDKRKELVELGAMGLSGHWLSDEARERAMGALRRIKILGDGWAVDEHLAYATSAIREARNGGEFLETVRKELGIVVRTISGEREAGLIYDGVRIAVDMPAPTLIVDIGGGSTEFVVGTSSSSILETSLKLGAARLHEGFIRSDPVAESDRASMRGMLARELSQVIATARANEVRTLVGSSGGMENLVKVAVARQGDPSRTIFQQRVSAAVMLEVTADLIASSHAERLQIREIDERRTDQIVAAAILVQFLLENISIETVLASPNALREGMVVHFIRQNHERLEQLAPFGDVRRRSVNELGFRCQWEVRHAHKVAELAVLLFDATQELHSLEDGDRELLEFAGLLHDVGYHINRSNHHKHSHYVIANAGLNGFQPEEIDLIALVARFHAGACPTPSHQLLRRLPDDFADRVLKLAALLRMAEGLDRSHFQNVVSLKTRLKPGVFEIRVDTDSDPQLDVWGGERGGDLFEQLFGRPVKVVVD